MRNWAFLFNDRARKMRAVMVLAATALIFAAMLVSFKQAPRGEAQVYVSGAADAPQESVDALAEFVTSRAASRISQMEALDRLIDAGGEGAEDAAQQKLELVGFMEDENALEGMLRAQGFEGAVCSVHSDSCNVMVRQGDLSQAQTARILACARDQTGLSPANIKIIPVQ